MNNTTEGAYFVKFKIIYKTEKGKEVNVQNKTLMSYRTNPSVRDLLDWWKEMQQQIRDKNNKFKLNFHVEDIKIVR